MLELTPPPPQPPLDRPDGAVPPEEEGENHPPAAEEEQGENNAAPAEKKEAEKSETAKKTTLKTLIRKYRGKLFMAGGALGLLLILFLQTVGAPFLATLTAALGSTTLVLGLTALAAVALPFVGLTLIYAGWKAALAGWKGLKAIGRALKNAFNTFLNWVKNVYKAIKNGIKNAYLAIKNNPIHTSFVIGLALLITAAIMLPPLGAALGAIAMLISLSFGFTIKRDQQKGDKNAVTPREYLLLLTGFSLAVGGVALTILPFFLPLAPLALAGLVAATVVGVFFLGGIIPVLWNAIKEFGRLLRRNPTRLLLALGVIGLTIGIAILPAFGISLGALAIGSVALPIIPLIAIAFALICFATALFAWFRGERKPLTPREIAGLIAVGSLILGLLAFFLAPLIFPGIAVGLTLVAIVASAVFVLPVFASVVLIARAIWRQMKKHPYLSTALLVTAAIVCGILFLPLAPFAAIAVGLSFGIIPLAIGFWRLGIGPDGKWSFKNLFENIKAKMGWRMAVVAALLVAIIAGAIASVIAPVLGMGALAVLPFAPLSFPLLVGGMVFAGLFFGGGLIASIYKIFKILQDKHPFFATAIGPILIASAFAALILLAPISVPLAIVAMSIGLITGMLSFFAGVMGLKKMGKEGIKATLKEKWENFKQKFLAIWNKVKVPLALLSIASLAGAATYGLASLGIIGTAGMGIIGFPILIAAVVFVGLGMLYMGFQKIIDFGNAVIDKIKDIYNNPRKYILGPGLAIGLTLSIFFPFIGIAIAIAGLFISELLKGHKEGKGMREAGAGFFESICKSSSLLIIFYYFPPVGLILDGIISLLQGVFSTIRDAFATAPPPKEVLAEMAAAKDEEKLREGLEARKAAAEANPAPAAETPEMRALRSQANATSLRLDRAMADVDKDNPSPGATATLSSEITNARSILETIPEPDRSALKGKIELAEARLAGIAPAAPSQGGEVKEATVGSDALPPAPPVPEPSAQAENQENQLAEPAAAASVSPESPNLPPTPNSPNNPPTPPVAPQRTSEMEQQSIRLGLSLNRLQESKTPEEKAKFLSDLDFEIQAAERVLTTPRPNNEGDAAGATVLASYIAAAKTEAATEANNLLSIPDEKEFYYGGKRHIHGMEAARLEAIAKRAEAKNEVPTPTPTPSPINPSLEAKEAARAASQNLDTALASVRDALQPGKSQQELFNANMALIGPVQAAQQAIANLPNDLTDYEAQALRTQLETKLASMQDEQAMRAQMTAAAPVAGADPSVAPPADAKSPSPTPIPGAPSTPEEKLQAANAAIDALKQAKEEYEKVLQEEPNNLKKINEAHAAYIAANVKATQAVIQAQIGAPNRELAERLVAAGKLNETPAPSIQPVPEAKLSEANADPKAAGPQTPAQEQKPILDDKQAPVQQPVVTPENKPNQEDRAILEAGSGAQKAAAMEEKQDIQAAPELTPSENSPAPSASPGGPPSPTPPPGMAGGEAGMDPEAKAALETAKVIDKTPVIGDIAHGAAVKVAAKEAKEQAGNSEDAAALAGEAGKVARQNNEEQVGEFADDVQEELKKEQPENKSEEKAAPKPTPGLANASATQPPGAPGLTNASAKYEPPNTHSVHVINGTEHQGSQQRQPGWSATSTKQNEDARKLEQQHVEGALGGSSLSGGPPQRP